MTEEPLNDQIRMVQAAARAPEWYNAYIGVAQMARQLESEELAYNYMVEQHMLAGNKRMVETLGRFPIPELDRWSQRT